MCSDPATGFGPDHAPEALQVLTAELVQLKRAVVPGWIVPGVAVMVTEGFPEPGIAGGVDTTEIVLLSDTTAFVLLQTKLYEVVCVGVTTVVPESGRVPDHLPVAVQEVAPEDAQLKTADPPGAITEGLTANETIAWPFEDD